MEVKKKALHASSGKKREEHGFSSADTLHSKRSPCDQKTRCAQFCFVSAEVLILLDAQGRTFQAFREVHLVRITEAEQGGQGSASTAAISEGF